MWISSVWLQLGLQSENCNHNKIIENVLSRRGLDLQATAALVPTMVISAPVTPSYQEESKKLHEK